MSGLAREIQTTQDLVLVALDIERQQVNLAHPGFVKQAAQRMSRNALHAMVSPTEGESPLDIEPIVIVRPAHSRKEIAELHLDIAAHILCAYERTLKHLGARPNTV
jgi:hypothetical protein